MASQPVCDRNSCCGYFVYCYYHYIRAITIQTGYLSDKPNGRQSRVFQKQLEMNYYLIFQDK